MEYGTMMYSIMLFIHVVSATLLGIYVVLPFIWGKANELLADAQYSYIQVLSRLNIIGQVALLFLLITGGAMIGSPDDTMLQFMMVAIVLLLIIGALTGITGSRMRKMLVANKSGKLIVRDVSRIKFMIWLNALFVLAAIYAMVNNENIFPLW